MINEAGGISNPDNVPMFVRLMKDETTSSGRVLLLRSLQHTNKQAILKKFIMCNGLKILTSWLDISRTSNQIEHSKNIVKVCFFIRVP